MDETTITLNKIQPHRRRRLFVAVAVLAYGVFLGEIYSVVHFGMWLMTHLLTLALLALALLWPALRERRWPATPLDAPLLVMAAVMIISALASAWPRLALEGLFVWLSHVLAFYLAVRLVYRGWGDSLLRALMLVTGVVVLIALFELAAWYFGLAFVPQFSQGWWDIGGLSHPIPPVWRRLSFALSNAVILSAFLVPTLPVAITFAVTTRRLQDRPLIWLFLLLAILVLAATKSRGGWLGFGTGLLTLTVLWLGRNLQRFSAQKKKLLAGLFVAVSLMVVWAIFLYIWTSWDARRGSNSERVAYWQAAGLLFVENPVWGVGPGLFRWGWRLTPFATAISDRVVTAHSIYLNQLVELGLAGLLSGAWLLGAGVFAGWQVLARTTDRRLWWRRAGCAAGLVGFLVQGAFEALPIWPIVLPVVVLAAYLMAPYTPQARARPIFWSKLGRYAGPVAALSWLAAALLLTYFAYPRLLAERARGLAARGNYSAAIGLMAQSSRLDPGLVLYQFEQATWLARPKVGRWAEARSLLRQALAFEPSYGLNHANLAAVEWQLGHRPAALAEMQQAVKLSPDIALFWLTLGNYAEESGQETLAASAYAQALVANTSWVGSGYWQQTAWRRRHFPAIFEAAGGHWPPERRAHVRFENFIQAENLDSAEQVLAQATRSPLFYEDKARLSLARHQPETALAQIELALERAPASASARTLQAEIYLELSQRRQAGAALKQALFLSRGQGVGEFYVKGRLAEAQGQFEQAEAAYRQGYQTSSFSLDYTVAMYRQLGSLLPLPQLQNTSSGENSARGWLALARLYIRQGRLVDAADLYKTLLANDPYFETARQELEELCREHGVGCAAPD